jgi:pSer/pThr/pTyr-binding forkhead associated (FHA) protein
MPKLVVHKEGGKEEHELGSEPVTLGRSSSCSIVLEDEQASREHCRVEPEDDGWVLVDLDSSNGTSLDGRRIQRERLRHGALIRVGQIRISFVAAPAAPPPEPPAAEEAPQVPAGLSLLAHGGPVDGEAFSIEKPVIQIGRSPDNDITLDDPGVSKHHAELIVRETGSRIIDRNSRNGVRVNGVRISDRNLDPGDRIQIGSTTIEFVGGAAAAAGPQAAQAKPAPAPATATGLAAVFTTRVKVVAAVVAAVIVGSVVVKGLSGAGSRPTRFRDNLLNGKNPSFEPGRRVALPAWTVATGSAEGDRDDVADGAQALVLVSAVGAGSDISALAWSSEVPVAAGKSYEFSALVKNSGSESAAFCARWRNAREPWLEELVLGERTHEALAWRRVTETFVPPSWATHLDVGCVVIGQGRGKFDGARLRETAQPRPRPRVATGRVALELGRRGEFLILADDRPLLCRGRAEVALAGRLVRQSAGTLEEGSPTVRSRQATFVGKLGLDGSLPFSQSVSEESDRLLLHYEIDVADVSGATLAVRMRSADTVLEDNVTLERSDGGHSIESGPFENKTDVTLITFFSAGRRVFLKLSAPGAITASAAAGEAVEWRLGFPAAATADRLAVSLTWSASGRAEHARVTAAIQAGAQAELDEDLGRAARLYRNVMDSYPLYTLERARARERLRALEREIDDRLKRLKGLASRARLSEQEAHYKTAIGACEQLAKKLKGHDAAQQVAKTLAALRAEREAAAKKKQEREAARFLADAKTSVENKQYVIARQQCRYVIRHYPETKAAEHAAELLKALPKPE